MTTSGINTTISNLDVFKDFCRLAVLNNYKIYLIFCCLIVILQENMCFCWQYTYNKNIQEEYVRYFVDKTNDGMQLLLRRETFQLSSILNKIFETGGSHSALLLVLPGQYYSNL